MVTPTIKTGPFKGVPLTQKLVDVALSGYYHLVLDPTMPFQRFSEVLVKPGSNGSALMLHMGNGLWKEALVSDLCWLGNPNPPPPAGSLIHATDVTSVEVQYMLTNKNLAVVMILADGGGLTVMANPEQDTPLVEIVKHMGLTTKNYKYLPTGLQVRLYAMPPDY